MDHTLTTNTNTSHTIPSTATTRSMTITAQDYLTKIGAASPSTITLALKSAYKRTIFRRAELKDAVRINLIVLRAYSTYKTHFKAQGIVFERSSVQSVTETILNPTINLYVCELDDQVIACIETHADKECPSSCYIGQFAVDVDFQCLGIGIMTSSFAIKQAKDMNFQRVTITMVSFQRDMINLYESYGFKWDGSTKPFEFNGQKHLNLKCKVLTYELSAKSKL